MRTLIVIFIALNIFSCATPYQPHGLAGGFSSTQLSENVFRVSFTGNGYTNAMKATDYTLLRSAELSAMNGFDYFTVVNENNTTSRSSYTTPVTANTNLTTNTYGNVSAYGNTARYNSNSYGTATTTYSGGQTYNIAKPSSSNTIVCYKDKPNGFHYNAAFLINSLKTKYNIIE